MTEGAVAAVAATTPRIAAAALAAIRVDYEPLPAVLDIDTAMAPDAPLDHVRLALQLVHFLAEFVKCETLIGYVALQSLLESPGTLLDFFHMLFNAIEG